MKTVTFYTGKGGTSKTTSAINLAFCLRRRGHRILLVDADVQGSMSFLCSDNPSAIPLAQVLVGNSTSAEAIIPTLPAWNGISVLVGDKSTAAAELQLVNEPGRESRLKDALQQVANNYDYAIIDTAPTRGVAGFNALVAADFVVIPVSPGVTDFVGACACVELVQQVKRFSNPSLEIAGFLLTRWKKDKLSKDLEKQVRAMFPGQVFSTVVPEAVAVGVSNAHKSPVVSTSPDSPASLAYLNLSNEVLNYVEKLERRAS
jgi:chromosome partitioning protein